MTKRNGKTFQDKDSSKGRKPNRKGNSNYRKFTDDKEVTKDNSKFNDPSWYVKEGQMVKDVASLSFNNALGVPIILNDELSGINVKSQFNASLPGIMTINTAPAFGITYDARSPINIAANNIVGFIRSYNSGAKNYDAPDLMLMLGAMDSVYALIAHLMRAYGVARVFSHTNRYIGDALLYSMGFQGSEVRQNLANFRAYINMLITKASAICTPSIMSIYRRHFWMYSGVYKDEDIEKSQLYLYRPLVLWSYEENDETHDQGFLKANPVAATTGSNISPTLWTLYEWETFGDSLIDKLVKSQDIAIMSGDILKAYGEGNLWKLSLINEDYAVIPVFSEEVLDQIHNTSFAGAYITRGITSASTDATFDISGLNVEQSPLGDALIYMPQFIYSGANCYTRILDLDSENPEPERVIVATRNMIMMRPSVFIGSKTISDVSTCGSDIALTASLVQYNDTGSLQAISLWTSDVNSLTNYMALWKFKRAPIIYTMSSTNGSGNLQGINGAIDNYTTVSFDDLRRMHESALLAMLGVPFYGLQTR